MKSMAMQLVKHNKKLILQISGLSRRKCYSNLVNDLCAYNKHMGAPNQLEPIKKIKISSYMKGSGQYFHMKASLIRT